jgi:formate hydrogenlyase subunit 6/NADH:ubiquinone oxidoreductase subunit I
MMKHMPGKIGKMALRHLVRKPATVDYPHGEIDLIDHYRGKLIYDPECCIDCKLCERDCPTGAIKIINEGTKKDRKMKAVLDVGRCVFCCQCVDSCSKKCLSCSQIYDLASQNKDDLTKPIGKKA